MKLDPSKLPDGVEALRAMIRRMATDHETELRQLQDSLQKERNEGIEHQNKALEYFEELQLMRRRLFGRSAERLSEYERKQLWLFNEAERIVASENKAEEEVQRIAVRAHTRVKRGRKPLPEDLPRIEVLHDIPEEDKICACGQRLQRIGEDTCEKLEIIPAQVRVKRHIRPRYACKACEGSGDEEKPAVRIAPAFPQLLPKSIATPSLVAYMITAKFCDGLPFYRQEGQFQRIGIDISRQDMANWSIRVHHRVAPLLALLREEIRRGPVVGIDETTVQVLKEPDRPNTSVSYMWVFRGGMPEHPVVEYQYHPTRSGSVPLEYLSGYQGYVQSDGYEGYEEVGRQPGVIPLGCWAHARRKYYEAKVVSKHSESAAEALSWIDKIFEIERKLRARDLAPEEFAQQRRQEVTPLLEQLGSWIQTTKPQVPPSTLLGKAIGYTSNQWDKLVRYLDSPLLVPHNNACEQAIRPFVVGRKAWLFSGSPVGATASAGWYSLIQTARINAVEPYLYLRFVLSRLPESKDPEDYRMFLPWEIDKGLLLDFDSGHLF
jgi:transposase